MNAFKMSTIWQEGVAKNFSKLFSSNKSVEEDNATNNTSERERKFSRGSPLEKDVGAVRTEKDAVNRKPLMKPHTVASEHKEMDSQVLEHGADEADSSENEQDIPVPPTITYSTYRGARRIRRRRCQRKPFQPLCPIISEVDERSLISLVDQPLINQMKEEINHCVFLQAPTVTEIQTPSEEKVPLIDNGKGNSELQPRINIVKFPSNKAGLAQDAKTENDPQTQQIYLSGVSREIELTGPHYQESCTKIGSECSPVTTGTINSTKEQVLQPDTSVSNIPSIQKISAVNPDDISVPGKIMTPEHLHSNGSSVPKRDTQYFIQLLTDHNDKSHGDEYYADITTSKITAQTDSPSKTTIQMDPQQTFHVPSASKAICTKGNETDVPKATADAVEAATTQNLKPVNLNNLTPLRETDQQVDNTDWKRKSIVANSEDGALAVPVVICSKQDDMEKETEKTEPVSESEKQGLVRENFDTPTDPTKNVSFTNPVKTIHLCNELDTPKVILNDNYDAQLKIASSTQTNGHTTVSGHFAVFNNEMGIPDASTNDMPKEYKNKDNVTGLTTRSLTTDTGSAIEKLLKESSQTTQWKSVPDTIQVNEESSSEVLEKQMSKDSSMLTTVEARTEDAATSTNVTNESTVVIENDKHLKIPSATVSKIAAAPSAMQSYGVNKSESTITTQSPENSEASSLENEGSLYAQKPDQLFKISPVKEHDQTSDSLAGTLASSLEPKLSKAIKPSLANESIFYRYYQESSVLLLDSDKNAHSIANSETVTEQAVEENQSVEEIQDNEEASNFVAMPKDANETPISTSKCSQSGNSLWYRCFQQSTGLLNTWESTQPNIIGESNLGDTQSDEIAELAKPIALGENCAREAIESTLHGDSLNNSKMAYSNEQMAKKINSYDNGNASATNSDNPEDEETALKIMGQKELITMQSRAQLITETCTVDESQAHSVERVIATDSDNILEGATKVEEEIISSAVRVTPHTQLSTRVIKEDVTNTQIDLDMMKTARLVDTKDDDLNENTNNVTMNNTIKEEPVELVKTVQVNDERLMGMEHSDIQGKSENYSRQVTGGGRQDKSLVTHENASEYVPSIHRADVKDVSIMMEPQEKSISLAPLLPVGTDLTLVHAAKDVRNQEEGSGLLNLTSTSHATGSTESAFQTIGVKVNDGEVGAEDPVKETEQRTELSKTVIAAEDSLSGTSSKIMKTENNSDHMGQEFSAALSEQCNIIDPTQNPAVLTTDSVKSTQSNDTQENVVSVVGKSQPNSEADHFQSGSVELKIGQSSLSTDQNNSSILTTKSEDGTCMISPQISNIALSDLVKPVNEVKKRKIQKMILSVKEAIPSIQLPDVAQVSLSDTGPATESNMTSPPVSKSGVGWVALTEPITPHTQTCSIVNKDDVTTAETASDITKAASLMERVNAVDLNKSTNNLPIDNTIDEEPEELRKTAEVNVERVKGVVHSEITEESENTLGCTSGEERRDKPLAEVSENLPSIFGADVKDVSIVMEPQEKSISLAPLLPLGTDLTLVHAAKDVRNQEEGSGLLNLTSTSQATGSTESAFQPIGVKVNDCEVGAEDPVKETEQRTELSKTVIAAEDSLSETSSEIMKTENNSDHMAQELPAALSEQCSIIDPTQSTAVLTTDSVKSTQSNDVHGNSIAVFGKSKSGQLADPGGFTNESMKDVEEVESGRNTEPQETFDFFAHLANVPNGHATKSTDFEGEMGLQYLEQEALILDTPLSHRINRRRIYPFALPPIYEEQELEDDVTIDMYNMTHSPILTTEYNSNQRGTSVHEPTATSLQLMQTENIVQEIEEEKQNPTGPVSVLEVSTSVSSDHLQKATIISHAINEKQNLSSPLQTEACLDGSNDSPKPKSSAAGDSIFYRYFQSSEDYLTKVEKALPESEPKMFTDLQQKPVEDSNLLKCSPDSKCLVKNKSLRINPRPGKVVIYDQLNFHGNKREIFTDIPDATSWSFSAGISFQSIRGCWMLCEKSDFQGQTHVLEEGQGELNELWIVERFQKESTPTKIVIGSIKRIVKNHSIPEIAIFQEPQQDDIKTYLHSEVTCLEECGITTSVSSIIVNSGIWLAYYMENFSGRRTLLDTGNSSVPLTSEVKSNNIKSLRPLEMGGLKVERPMAPQVIIFEKTFFNGRFKEICEDASDLKNLWEDDFKGVGSVRVIGGVWVCYEKECYRGHQYLLEEGEYEDWQAWGGFDSTVQSMRFIQADYMKPEIILFEEADFKKGNDAFVTHAIPHLESIGYGTETRSIEVKNGVWVAYHEEHYSGEQYILEKGVYRNYTGWGGGDSSIMSIRPIQLEPVGGNEAQFQLRAYKGIDFQGESVEFITEIPSLPSLQPNSFKVSRGCWILYDEKDYSGCQYVLEEGQYRDLDSLGCLSAKLIQSLKPIRTDFSMPSISLFSLYSFEGQKLILTEGTSCWKNKDYCQTPKSVKVNGGIWVAYEHANYRGKQLLLECTEITNWNKFSGWKTIGSVHPLKQPGVYFQVKNKATGEFVTVVGGSKDPRESKLTVCPYNGKPTQMWFYCHGLIKSKANSGCIAAIGGHVKAGAKVNLWTEHGRTHQKWNINRDGTISSFLDSSLRLDIKGGDFYDKDHIILNFPEEQQQSQFWDIEVLR